MVDGKLIAVIVDIQKSRSIEGLKRKEMDIRLRQLLQILYNRFERYLVARPMLTQGDSIEILVNDWRPVAYLFHRLHMEDIRFRVGIGTGEIIILRDSANECDGPAFWNAREELEEVKTARYKGRIAGFRFDRESHDTENNEAIKALLFLTTLQGMTPTQSGYCYYYIWEARNITEIAQHMNTTKGNVSKTLNKTPCHLLAKIIVNNEEFQ